MFDWTVKNESEAKEEMADLIKGRYNAVVKSVDYGVSKAGNNYLKLTLIIDFNGTNVFCDDYMVDTKKMFFKRKHFWESAGLPHFLNADGDKYIAKNVVVDCDVEEYDSTKYSKKMKKFVVMDYVPKEDFEVSTTASTVVVDDDIPF